MMPPETGVMILREPRGKEKTPRPPFGPAVVSFSH
jgi:hypothetical protein